MSDMVDKIFSALGSRNGLCFCPAHDNTRTPALSVSEGNGKVLVKCHAGCPQEAVVAALKQRSLWPVHAKQSQTVSKADERQRKRAKDYEDGERISRAFEILYTANQNHTKDDRAMLRRYLSGRGIESVPANALLLRPSQSSDLGIGPRFPAMVMPIIRGDQLVAAQVTWLSSDGTQKLKTEEPRKTFGLMSGGCIQLGYIDSKTRNLVVGEGVETVLSAAEILGWPALAAISATNLPKVTHQFPKADNIIIAADNDDAGREAAEEAARRFNALDCRVRIALPPDDYNDWNDALCAARDDTDIDELRDIILDAPVFDGRTQAHAKTMAEVMAMEIPPRQYLLKPWLETSSINMIHGQRGEGKTFAILGTAHAIATGSTFLGWTPQRSARVLYVDGELPGAVLQKRLQYLGPPTENLRVLSRDLLLDDNIALPDLAAPEGRAFLDKIIEQHDSEVIMLDSLSTLFRSGVENDAESWQAPQDWMMTHRFRGRTIIFAHHEGKTGTPRGTSKREDTLDSAIKIRRRDDLKEDDAESAFEITFTKTRGFTDSTRPLIARMSVSAETGTAEWRHEFASAAGDEVVELLDAGWTQKDIAKKVNLSPGRVSQIAKKKRAKEEV